VERGVLLGVPELALKPGTPRTRPTSLDFSLVLQFLYREQQPLEFVCFFFPNPSRPRKASEKEQLFYR
jgi:hypothetical protein